MSEIARHEAASTAVATSSDSGIEGLEDFEASDLVMPRLRIVGKDAEFEDNLTGERHGKITVILLGLVKQRILWAPEVEDGDGPLCRSLDFHNGLPFVKEFPWKESGFDRRAAEDAAADAEHPSLACNSCALKEWGTNPKGSTPWCSEQHTYPLMLNAGEDNWMPAILTLQRSGIKASKAYTSGFARARQPLYTAVTEISLRAEKRGSVDYATPIFQKKAATEEVDYPEYAQNYRQIREFLQSQRSTEEPTEPRKGDGGATPTEAPSYAADDEPPF